MSGERSTPEFRAHILTLIDEGERTGNKSCFYSAIIGLIGAGYDYPFQALETLLRKNRSSIYLVAVKIPEDANYFGWVPEDDTVYTYHVRFVAGEEQALADLSDLIQTPEENWELLAVAGFKKLFTSLPKWIGVYEEDSAAGRQRDNASLN